MKSVLLRSMIQSALPVSALLLSCSSKTQEANRPNIIFILTDDQRWDALGYAGNQIIKTPEMDALASSGVYFSHAMVTTPICAASRASIFTGLYERTHKFDFSTDDIKDEYMAQSYPKLLRNSGYYTGFFGKFGVKYKKHDQLFDQFDVYDRGNFGDRRSFYYKTINGDSVHLTRFTGHQAIEFIKKAPANQPFCLSLSFSAPHAADEAVDQYFWTEETDYLYQDLEMPPAKISEDKYFNMLPEEVRKGFNRVRWGWRYDTPEKYQHSVKGYYRMIADVDLEIGKIRKQLKEKGIDKNTVIIFMGDNGYFLNERQLAGKWLMYDNSLRVPLIIYDPRQKNQQDISEMALNIDVPSTMLDMAGVERPASWQGKSLFPVVKGSEKSLGRDTVLFEHLWEFEHIPPSEGVRTPNFKYLRYVNNQSVEELYNLEDDPLEINNLVENSAYAQTLKSLRSKTDQLGLAYSDSLSQAPVSVSFKNMELTWVVPSTAIKQRGYQILVSSSPEKCRMNIGDLWDSKHQVSQKSTNIPYKGLALNKNQTVYYKVRIWDVANRLTRYSDENEWTFK